MSDTGPDAFGREQSANAYRVLARKYRPKDFSDLMVGQEPMVRTLTNAFETGRITQAYILTGMRGVGKTTTARILARALNYKSAEIDRPSIDLSIPGEHCQAIMEGHHVDVIEMDAASHTGIDDIRELIEQVRYRPVSARYKVYIIDEVHMLSTPAFNGLLKTLEEPPEHVKFIFATTEIRKVPITVLSRCQRFDLQRISAADLVGLFGTIAAREGIAIDDQALAMVARAAEGSARDGLSLLDQAIAHGGGRVEAETVRQMLGLADRARIVDLFDHIVKGDVAAALGEFAAQYEVGANPVAVLTDLADFTHLVTRLKYVPDAAQDPSLAEIERLRGKEFSENLAVSALSRLWQMLLKGIPETENSSRPAAAAEMVLIRLAHAASLPSPEDAVRRVLELSSEQSEAGLATPAGGAGGGTQADSSTQAVATAQPYDSASMALAISTETRPQEVRPPEVAKPKVPLHSLQDIADLCSKHGDSRLKALLRSFVRLVRLEPGRLQMRLAESAPGTLPGELGVKLKEWTGIHWIVSLSRDEGQPTLAEAEAMARDARLVDARQDPDVAAILAQFPGAKITDVRILPAARDEAEESAAPPLTSESSEGDIFPGDDVEF